MGLDTSTFRRSKNKVTNKQTDKQTDKVTSSLLELLVAAKNMNSKTQKRQKNGQERETNQNIKGKKMKN